MMGSTTKKSDQYSKLIELVSKPEALTERLDELKKANEYHEEVYQKAITAKEAVEDATKQLNEKADAIAQQIIAREKVVSEDEEELAAGLLALEAAQDLLEKQQADFAAEIKYKESQLTAGHEHFEAHVRTKEEDIKAAWVKIHQAQSQQIELEQIVKQQLATQKSILEAKEVANAGWSTDLQRQEDRLKEFLRIVTEAAKLLK